MKTKLIYFISIVIIFLSCKQLHGQVRYYKFIDDDRVNDAINDERTFWYNTDKFKRVIDSGGKLYHHGYNIAGSLDKTGSAANEQPWHTTSGVEDLEDKVVIDRFAYVPEGTKIKVDFRTKEDTTSRKIDKRWFYGEYPDNFVAGQIFRHFGGPDAGEPFAVRALVKEDGEWSGVEYENPAVAAPKGYSSPGSCVDCHEDVGKSSFELDVKRDWYGVVGVASEPGGPIALHPFKWEKNGKLLMHSKPEANPKVSHMFDLSAVANIVEGVKVELPKASGSKPKFIYFGGHPWCGPCRAVSAILKSTECKKELENWDYKHYNNPNNDAEFKAEDRRMFDLYKISTVPVVIIQRDGKMLTYKGQRSKSFYLNLLKNPNFKID